ncbi:DUF6446 family protein [Sulfitobacter donghicola]|uniref:Signal transduction histidine kinase n=1 Tax=Sulfitobacter donghicola DSW-25 = KCTC 12864 = JCM 14565 TaxID=1300350 RepID=A0A073IKH0_9RHOB|nr:DUF6446 family protein [Sulfitobacter donghicola]KEJ90030.1 signal transduction histidine kinase [Sulfitobacter donghicola DSW-25 = KCTC 12864 = JCM 14565]KIN66836.1 Signal transduction histidine kinase regulating citrate/malate metabolism [Sulfitobacter donghicola DSW-25 = KCTC 12864 = JCM 14565]
MNGKIIGIVIVVSSLIAGAALYYLQIYGFYQEVDAPAEGIELMALSSGEGEVIPLEGFRAIDAESSPIRYRACFTTPYSLALLTETFQMVEGVEPRNAPGWFDCFDAAAIADELKAGTALTFLSEKNVHYGVDRIVAITDDGRGYVWHELNDCGEKAYDGTVVGEECPALPTAPAPTE